MPRPLSQITCVVPPHRRAVEAFLGAVFPLVTRTVEDSAESVLRAITLPARAVAGRYMHNDSISYPNR